VRAPVVPAGTSFAERASMGHVRSDETEWPIPLVDKRTVVRYDRRWREAVSFRPSAVRLVAGPTLTLRGCTRLTKRDLWNST
jgi:hypothetical protein